jgi:regulator of protease activity HflC (stomatin/prohibitin superfamily)
MADQIPGPGGPGGPESQSPFDESREASVTLRARPGVGAGDDLDTANKSLADAFRMSFRVLQLGMLALVVVYLFSGFQTVKEGERGIRMLFGRPISGELDPGFTPSWPYPLGELVRVNVNGPRIDMLNEFWPKLGPRDRNLSDSELQGRWPQLAPDRDNSLMTADQNLAHLRIGLQYRRDNARDFISNIYHGNERDSNEERIVRHAVKRAAVHVIAQTPIEDLLKVGESAGGEIQGRIMRHAQATLDRAGSGLRLSTLTLDRVTAPHAVLQSFDQLQQARQDAASRRVQAATHRQSVLNEVAGAAAEVMLELIGRYEEATDLGDAAQKDEIFEQIAALVRGDPIELDGETVHVQLSGEAASILLDADNVRARLVSRRRAARDLFVAKQAQIDASSEAMVLHADWVEAVTAFMDRDTVEIMLLPRGIRELRLNSDPDLRREIDRQMRRRVNLQASEERDRRLRQEQMRIDTDQRLMDGG